MYLLRIAEKVERLQCHHAGAIAQWYTQLPDAYARRIRMLDTIDTRGLRRPRNNFEGFLRSSKDVRLIKRAKRERESRTR